MSRQTIEGFQLSPQQEHLWAHTQGDAATRFRALALVRVDGALDTAALQAAVELLGVRHEILRTTFRLLPGMKKPLQTVTSPPPTVIQHDLASQPQTARQGMIARLCDTARERPLNFAEGPLFEVVLIAEGPRLYRLILTLPTLCSDVAGLECLTAELSRCYAAVVQSKELTDEPLQYIDLAAWQIELFEGEEAETGRAFWRDRAAVARASSSAALSLVGALPTADPGPSLELRSVEVSLASALATRLSTVAVDLGFPVEALLLASWQGLLWRLAEEPDVLAIGCHSDGRKLAELRETPGCFARYLPLWSRFAGDRPWRELVQEAAWGLEELRAWQEYFAWSDLVVDDPRLVPPSWGFTYERSGAKYRAGDVSFTVELRAVVSEPFVLELRVIDNGGAFVCELRYDAGRVAAPDAERLLKRFNQLLASACSDPATSVAELSIVGTAERRLLVEELNATACEHPRAQTLYELVREQAIKTPQRIAVEAGEGALSYEGLMTRVAALSRVLQRSGVGPEETVGVCLDPSLDLPTALLAIFASGGAYVPLDPTYPAERLAQMLADVRPAVLLTRRELLASSLGPVGALSRHIDLDDLGWLESVESVNGSGRAASQNVSDPDGLAYVIFTSGSTGRPKGVMISHRAIVNRLLWMERVHPLEDGDRVLQKTAFSFDASVWELFVPLLAGARLVMAAPGGARESSYLVQTVAERRVTILQLVPSMLRLFLAEERIGECRSLRRLFCGGEALPGEVADRLQRILPVELVNLYGPTECSIDVSSYLCHESGRVGVLPIGEPLDNTRLYLLDRSFDLVPFGLPGELFAGGRGVGRGYLERPALTADRFLPDPYTAVPGERLYRTGDLGRWSTAGVLEFLGRIDHQVKLRGFRIELGEIESWLGRYEGVRECAVMVRDDLGVGDGESGQQLVAYVVPAYRDAYASAPFIAELRQHLKAQLPSFMVPSRFVMLEALPRAPNGKIDWRALPAPSITGGEGFAAPRTPTQQIVAAVWADVFGAERVGVNDNFFTLGGHSLVATRVTSRLRKAFQIELRIQTLFDHPTVTALAAEVERLSRTGEGVEAPPIERLPRSGDKDVGVLSYAQQRLWFLEQLRDVRGLFNIPEAVRFRGPLMVAALARAIDELVRRHESLRTTFAEERGKAVQVIAPACSPSSGSSLPLVDLSRLGGAAEAEARRHVGDLNRRPFDLRCGPLFRVVLCRLDEDDHVVSLTVHHIISDAWSMGVMMRELTVLYEAFVTGQPASLAVPAVQYRDFAAWQRAWLTGEVLERQLEYWRHQLRGAPPVLDLPTDRPRPEAPSWRGRTLPVELSASLTGSLNALSRRSGVTLFMNLLAIFDVLLQHLSGQDDVVVGTNVANRNRAETEGVIGFFINQLALRSNLEGDPTFAELLTRVRQVALGAYTHQDLPFDLLVNDLRLERSLRVAPLFQVKMYLENTPQGVLELPELDVEAFGIDFDLAQLDLTLAWREVDGRLTGWINYKTDLFDVQRIRRLMERFTALAAAVCERPEVRLSELRALLDEMERTEQAMDKEALRAFSVNSFLAIRPRAVAADYGVRQESSGQGGEGGRV